MILFNFTNLDKRTYILWNIWAIIIMIMSIVEAVLLGIWMLFVSVPIIVFFLITLYKTRRKEKILRRLGILRDMEH